MKKPLKILLISIAALAIVGGVAGAVFGTNNSIKSWFDEKVNGNDSGISYPSYDDSDFNNPSSGGNSSSDSGNNSSGGNCSENQGGNSQSNPGDDSGGSGSGSGSGQQDPNPPVDPGNHDDENCEIVLSKSRIFLQKNDLTSVTSEPFSASIEGNPSDDRLLWWPLSNAHLSISKTVTEPDEELTVSSAYFNETQYIRVCMLANTNIYKDLPVIYANEFTKMDFEGIGIFSSPTSGSSKAICSYSSYEPSASAKTWTDHAGTYFHCDSLYRSQRGWYSTPEVALEAGHICEVTASPGAAIYIKSQTHTRSQDNFYVMNEEHEFNSHDQSTFTVDEFTDIEFESTGLFYDDYASDWYVFFMLQIPNDFEGQTGTVVLEIMDQWYYAIHFNAYHGVTSNTLNETEVSFEA